MRPARWPTAGLFLSLLFLFAIDPAPARANGENRCTMHPCGSCCSRDTQVCCCLQSGNCIGGRPYPGWTGFAANARMTSTDASAGGATGGCAGGALDSLATAWQVTPEEASGRIARAQEALVRAVMQEARSRRLGRDETKRLLQERLDALEIEMLGRPLRELSRVPVAAPGDAGAAGPPVGGRGASLGYLALLVGLAGLVIVRWGHGLARALRTA